MCKVYRYTPIKNLDLIPIDIWYKINLKDILQSTHLKEICYQNFFLLNYGPNLCSM